VARFRRGVTLTNHCERSTDNIMMLWRNCVQTCAQWHSFKGRDEQDFRFALQFLRITLLVHTVWRVHIE